MDEIISKIKCINQSTGDIFISKDKCYDIYYINNKWTKSRNYIGYILDDEKFKRWITKEFREKHFNEEEWREYNYYKVSNLGKVINKHGKTLSTNVDSHGYVMTSIVDYDGSKIKGLHRVVATVFLENPNNLPEVNHKDGKKENNRVDNLEWCTHEYNMQHEVEVLKQRNCEKHWFNILTEEKVREVYNLCKERNLLYKEIAEMYGIYPQEVSDIARGKLWRDLGLEPLPKVVRGSRRNGQKGFTEHTY